MYKLILLKEVWQSQMWKRERVSDLDIIDISITLSFMAMKITATRTPVLTRTAATTKVIKSDFYLTDSAGGAFSVSFLPQPWRSIPPLQLLSSERPRSHSTPVVDKLKVRVGTVPQ